MVSSSIAVRFFKEGISNLELFARFKEPSLVVELSSDGSSTFEVLGSDIGSGVIGAVSGFCVVGCAFSLLSFGWVEIFSACGTDIASELGSTTEGGFIAAMFGVFLTETGTGILLLFNSGVFFSPVTTAAGLLANSTARPI